MNNKYVYINQASTQLKALGTASRQKIMTIICNSPNGITISELMNKLNLTQGAISSHLKILETAGLIKNEYNKSIEPHKKLYFSNLDSLLIKFGTPSNILCYQDEIPIGLYSSHHIKPACGIATPQKVIGIFDDSRYFSFPEHVESGIFWFNSGYVEYIFPNRLMPNQQITKLEISFEISSGQPNSNVFPASDINFYFNDIYLGYWTTPENYLSQKGLFTPEWWPSHCSQFGFFKTISITPTGTFIDNGTPISDISLLSLNLNHQSIMKFKISIDENSRNRNGCTLYGKNYGNYNQHILFYVYYKNL